MRFYSENQIKDMAIRYDELSRLPEERMKLSERLEMKYIELKLDLNRK